MPADLPISQLPARLSRSDVELDADAVTVSDVSVPASKQITPDGFDAAADVVALAAGHTLTRSDANTLLDVTVGTAQNVTVPPNSSVAFPIGTTLDVASRGAGAVTIAAGAGVTLRYPAAQSPTLAQHGSVRLVKIGTDEWLLEFPDPPPWVPFLVMPVGVAIDVEAGDLVIGHMNYRDDTVDISGSSYPTRTLGGGATHTLLDSHFSTYDQVGSKARSKTAAFRIDTAGTFTWTSTLPSAVYIGLRVRVGSAIAQSDLGPDNWTGTAADHSLTSAPSGYVVACIAMAGTGIFSADPNVAYDAGWTRAGKTRSGEAYADIAYKFADQRIDLTYDAGSLSFGGIATVLFEIA